MQTFQNFLKCDNKLMMSCYCETSFQRHLFEQESKMSVLLEIADKSFVDSKEIPECLLCTRHRTGTGHMEKSVGLTSAHVGATALRWKMPVGTASWFLARLIFLGPHHMIPRFQ